MKREPIEELNNIKYLLKIGAIDYDLAKKMAEPHLKELNNRIQVIARYHNRKHTLITFAKFMR